MYSPVWARSDPISCHGSPENMVAIGGSQPTTFPRALSQKGDLLCPSGIYAATIRGTMGEQERLTDDRLLSTTRGIVCFAYAVYSPRFATFSLDPQS